MAKAPERMSFAEYKRERRGFRNACLQFIGVMIILVLVILALVSSHAPEAGSRGMVVEVPARNDGAVTVFSPSSCVRTEGDQTTKVVCSSGQQITITFNND